MPTNRLILVLLLVGTCFTTLIQAAVADQNEIEIVSNTVRCCDGKAIARSHHIPSLACRKEIIILGVGTAMTTNDYDQISKALVNASAKHDLLAIVLDPTPYDPLKLSETAFAFAVNRLVREIESLINVQLCIDMILMVGGHSAGGASAINALQSDLFTSPVAGYIGLDPYFVPTPTVGNVKQIPVPSLLWGFATTTCGVNIEHSAKAAYLSAPSGFRVFYQLMSMKFSHCCFTDSGCLWVCSCGQGNQNLLHDIGVSVDQFIDSIQSKSRFRRPDFSTSYFWLAQSDIDLFMDETLYLAKSVVPTYTRISVPC